MQSYQEEYIASLRDSAGYTVKGRGALTFEECLALADQEKKQAEERAKQNMKLLREELFPVLDHIYEADEAELYNWRSLRGSCFAEGRSWT